MRKILLLQPKIKQQIEFRQNSFEKRTHLCLGE